MYPPAIRDMKNSPRSFTALGSSALPNEIVADGRTFLLRQIFKNDFFATTAMYESDAQRVLLKVHRVAPFLGLPLRWLGRTLANREIAAFERLGDLDGIPRLIARHGRTGLIREFIEGHAMQKGERVPDAFHSRLRRLVEAIHTRGMAYVDLEKCENVLVGDDGNPYLFDFQIAWCWSKRRGGELWPLRSIRAWLQAGDRYHLRKLQRRTRPDQLSPDELAASYRKPWYVSAYDRVTRPYTWCRRRVLHAFGVHRGPGERGRIAGGHRYRASP